VFLCASFMKEGQRERRWIYFGGKEESGKEESSKEESGKEESNKKDR